MREHTIALAGLGRAACSIHLPAYARMPGLRVVAGCDPAARPGDHPFAVFASAEEMLDRTRPDILTVATPPESHHPLTRLGLEAGCHVFCEKPFMTTLEQADDIIALARRVGRHVVVNNQYRFMQIHAEARRRVGTPGFGRLLFLSAQQTFRVSERTEEGWRGRDPQRTCKEFGTHVFDLCRFLFDEEPATIRCRMPRPGFTGGPDLLNLIELEFSGDRLAHILLDRLCRGRHRYLEMRLEGSEGSLETRIGGGVELALGVRGGTRRPFVSLDYALGGQARLYHGERSRCVARDPLDIFVQATARLLTAALEAIAAGSDPPCHAEDNRRTLALMLAAYESHRCGAAVPLNPGRAEAG